MIQDVTSDQWDENALAGKQRFDLEYRTITVIAECLQQELIVVLLESDDRQ